MNLYEINGQILQLAEMLEAGEIDETVYNDTVQALGGEIAIEDIIKAIRNKNAEAEALKAEAERLTDKRKRCEACVEGMKSMILDYLNNTKQNKVKTDLFSVSKGASKSVTITDDSKIPGAYLIQQPPKIDKKAILAQLKAGEAISGAIIEEKEFITIK